MFQSALLTCLLPYAASGKTVSFLTIGDWGGSGLGGEHAQNQQAVATQMSQTASDSGISFVINTGDNFYYCGIQNTSDSQIQTDFENVYTADSLNVPWYTTLGNHEYGYDVDAQIQYKDPKGRWIIDSRYYSKRLQLASNSFMSLIVLDTSPCIQDYRNTDPKYWDPCGSDFPTCDPINEGTCEFHPNIMTQDCSSQLAWFKSTLIQVPKDDWLVIVGHHKAFEIDVADFLTPMMDRGFDLYLNGHTHTLDQYSIQGKDSFVTSGAGSMVDSADQHIARPLHADIDHQLIFNAKTAGFTVHTFSDDFSELKTDYVDTTGKVIHSFSVTKGSSPSPPPSPSPAPTPSPSPSGANTCAVIGCGHWDRSATCNCNAACKQHNDCCEDYDSTCGGSLSANRLCKQIGCGVYAAAEPCQCNEGCEKHDGCCPDFTEMCVKKQEMTWV